MKLWNNKLKASDLGTFYQIIFMRFKPKNYLSKGYLYHTGPLEKNVEDDLLNNDAIVPIKMKNIYDNKLDKNNLNDKNIENTQIELRNYQKEGLKKLSNNWNGIKCFIMPCGTGKTLVISNYLKNQKIKNIFIVSPLRIHAKQFLNYVKPFLTDYKTLLADSDGNLNLEDIKNILCDKSIISTTFKSAKDTISKLFDKKYNFNSDNSILIIDEAHNLINNDELHDLVKKFNKTLLVTATPPSQLNEIFDCETIFEYKMSEAIKDKFICDYQIYLPLIIDNRININKPMEIDHLDNELSLKGLFIINGLLKTGSKKCIVYLSNIKECEEFSCIIKEIMEKYHYLEYSINTITCETKNRNKILNKFQEDNFKYNFLLNVRILDEGVDVVKCDSVFVTKINDNEIKIVQRMCRANRLNIYNPNKICNCFIWTDEYNKTINTLSLLKENDVNFIKKISIINSNYDELHLNNYKESLKISNQKLLEFINIECLTTKELWFKKFNILLEFIELHKKVPIRKEIYKNINIGNWLTKQKSMINNFEDEKYIEMSKNEILKKCLDEYLTREKNNTFEESLNLLLEYIEVNKKVPSYKEIYKNINIGKWLSHQKEKIKNINDKIYIKMSKNEILKKYLDEYLTRNKIYTFEESLNLLLEYIQINNNIPPYKECYKNVHIGYWLTNQKTKINSTKDELYIKLSENNILKKCLDEYLSREKNNTFEESLNLLLEYIEVNKKVPLVRESYKNKNIGYWLNQQKKKINSSKDDMYIKLSKNEILKKCLDEYLRREKNNTFEESLNLIFEYIEVNKKVPYKKESYKNMNIGLWLSNQKQKIKNINDEVYIKLSKNKI